MPVDVVSPGQVKSLIRKAISTYGALDILVNCAGVQAPIGALKDADINQWIRNIQINLIGTMLCSKAALPYMLKKKKGVIINFSGGGAASARKNFSAYASSKAGVVRFTETLAKELRESGIRVNVIAPGAVDTRMLDEIIRNPARAGNEEVAMARNAKLAKNKASPAAELALFLASDDARGISGKFISALWDDWKNLSKGRALKSPSAFTLRRIDGRNFVEAK
jgi:3-oxoacyl-[acyl-carrier protein] reductase